MSKIDLKGVFAAASAFREAMRGNTVSPEEISRRLAVCAGCPKMRRTSGLSGRASAIVGAIANRHRVPPAFANRSCGVCGCSLLLLVPATGKDLHVDSPEEARKRPARCWMKGGAK